MPYLGMLIIILFKILYKSFAYHQTLNLNLVCTELCELLTFFLINLGSLILLDSVTCNWKQTLDLNIIVQCFVAYVPNC